MSQREKKISKQERKLVKERKAQERKCMQLLEYLDREIKYGNVTRKKNERRWRDLVISISLNKIRDDLEYTWHLYEWALDIKDCAISALMDELNVVNEQHSTCLQNHNMVIRDLLHSMKQHQTCLYEDFSKSLENMKQHYYQQFEQCKINQENYKISTKAALYRMSVEHENYSRDQKARNFCQLEYFMSTKNEKESYDEISRKNMRNLWQKSTKILNELISTCELYTSVMLKDRMAMELSEVAIRKHLKQLPHLTDVIKQFQAKLSFLQDTNGEKLKKTTETYQDFSLYLLILKNKLFNDNKRDARRMKLVICCSETVLEHFRVVLKKGEVLLRFMSVNRKYETSSEKVLPFPADEYYWKHTLSRLHAPSEMDKLHLFYQKLADVDASRLALNEEKKFLQMERTRLMRNFGKFCGCFECADKFPRIKPKFRKKQVIDDKSIEQKLRELSAYRFN